VVNRHALKISAAAIFLSLMPLHAAIADPQVAPPGEATSNIKPVEVDSEGEGPSRDAAVRDALSHALAQEGGVQVSSADLNLSADAHAKASSHEETTATSGNPGGLWTKSDHTSNDQSSSGNFSGQAAVGANLATSGGRVLRYNVISVQPAPEGGFVARVHAVLQIYRRAAGPADQRRSIVIGTFAGGGQAVAALHDQLLIDLTQTSRFTVLDRDHDDSYRDEMTLVGSADAAPDQIAHAGQALGADFILTGKLAVEASRTTGHAAQTTSHTIELTGEVVSHTSASTLHSTSGSAAVSFELIEVSTRQIRMADRQRVTGSGIEALAQHITDEIVSAIYPPRLLAIDDPTALIVSQGGNLMKVGQRFRLMQEGAELFDPYTHESLGKREREVGQIEISSVEPKISYARLVAGALPQSVDQAVLRAVETTAAALTMPQPRHKRVARALSPTPASSTDTGLRLPFDH
jgi:TolB-like protein